MIFSEDIPMNFDISLYRPYESKVNVSIRKLIPGEPITGGNKIYKLIYNVLKAKKLGKSKLATFGGAFSNHIAATARVGKIEGMKTLGIIRGEPASISNVTLSRASGEGMEFIFLNREEYKRKTDDSFLKTIVPEFDDYYFIAEGGANIEGIKGCMEILNNEDSLYDHIVVSCGTGTTAAGILLSMKSNQKLTGISVLCDGGSIETVINKWVNEFKPSQRLPRWEINHDFDFGGYAKKTKDLELYCDEFFDRTRIKIEPVYTGKMFFGIEKLIEKGYFKSHSKVLAIHTGGLQYLESLR